MYMQAHMYKANKTHENTWSACQLEIASRLGMGAFSQFLSAGLHQAQTC